MLYTDRRTEEIWPPLPRPRKRQRHPAALQANGRSGQRAAAKPLPGGELNGTAFFCYRHLSFNPIHLSGPSLADLLEACRR
jgi:hypothetical protein